MKPPAIEFIARGLWIEAGHVLVCRNRKHGHLFLPGGHVDFGEPAAVALQREVREELGRRLVVGQCLGATEGCFDARRTKPPRKHSATRTARPIDPASMREPHHEVNLVFTLRRPATHTRRAKVSRRVQGIGAAATPPVVRSREDHIEFLWLPVRNLESHLRRRKILPASIVQFIPLALELADDLKIRKSAQRTKFTWATDW